MAGAEGMAGPVPGAGRGRELATRVVVGAGLAVVAVCAAIAGGRWFAVLAAVACGLAVFEWGNLFQWSLAGKWMGALWIGSVFPARSDPSGHLVGLLVIALVGVGLRESGLINAHRKYRLPEVALYIGIAGYSLVWLRNLPEGLAYIAFTFAVVWSADIAAYAVGRTVGGPKLWPSISPNKTWAGFVGACVAACGAAVAVAPYVHVAPVRAAIAGLLLGALAQGGDLFESALKRRAGVKDSGTLLPGHGGVLDRLDSLIPVAPAVAGAVALGWL